MKRLALTFVVGMLAGAALLSITTREESELALEAAIQIGGQPTTESRSTELSQSGPDTDIDLSIGALADDDLSAAIGRILAIESPALRLQTIRNAVAVGAATDPAPALDAIRAIPNVQAREELLSAALATWSVEDAVAMFRYMASVDDWDLSRPGIQGPENLRLGLTLRNDNVDFRELAALVDDLPPPFDGTLRRSVIQGLTRQDPAAATQFFETLPDRERQEAGLRIANEYAKSDPLAAFEWARASGEPRFISNVLNTMAGSDPLGAVDLALQAEETANLRDVVRVAIRSESVAPDELAAALLALPESVRKERAIESMTDAWAVSEPEKVLEWLVAQGEAAEPSLFSIVAGRIDNLDMAASYTERIPPAARSEWIQIIAGSIASGDPDRAVEWIAQFRSESAYAPSVAVIANSMARYDGRAAVDLLRLASLESDPSAVSQVALVWASGGDRNAVINWLQTLTNDGVRRAALGDVARSWENFRPDDAERWVLSLPNDEERDAILYSMISAAFINNGEPSDTLFRAYSNDYARQVAVVNAAREIESYNEAAARRLLDRYVTDRDLRRLFDSGEALPPPN